MAEAHAKGEVHGCIVCGKLYQLYVVNDAQGKYIGCKVMTPGGRVVPNPDRPLVACDTHSPAQVEAAVERVFGPQSTQED